MQHVLGASRAIVASFSCQLQQSLRGKKKGGNGLAAAADDPL